MSRRITKPDSINPELYRTIGKFMGNTMIGIYKTMQNQGADFYSNKNNNLKVLLLAKFLNVCWRTMVEADYSTKHGENVKQNIMDGMAPLIPEESPRCLIHLLFRVGQHIIDHVDTPMSLNDATIVDLTNQCAQIAFLYFKNRGMHKCENMVTWNNLHEQTYAPIWELKPVPAEPKNGGNT